MRLTALAFLLVPWIFGCAAPPPQAEVTQTSLPPAAVLEETPIVAQGAPPDVETPPGTVSAESLAVIELLPLRIGPWVRSTGPADDGAIAQTGRLVPFARYTMPGTGSWATIGVNDHAMALPDGLNSSAIMAGYDASRAIIRTKVPGNAARMRMVWIPDAPSQRCVVGRAISHHLGNVHVACSTAVAGQELRIRVTAAFRPGDSGRLFELEGEIARLIAEVTRAAAGRHSEPSAPPQGRVFIPAFGPEMPL